MVLNLKNGMTINLPTNSKYNIFYGPNKIGKTQISIALKEYYENNEEKILLFNDNILNDMIIKNDEDLNSFEVMPMAQEYKKYYSEMQKYKGKLSIKNNLKELCSVNTKTAFQDFEKITEYINDDTFLSEREGVIPVYSTDEIKSLLKPKEIEYNLIKIIDKLIKDDIKVLPENVKKIVDYDIFSIQEKINKEPQKYTSCPVCFSPLSKDNLDKIKESIEKGTLEKELQLSILYYLDNKSEKLKNMMTEILLCQSYDEYKNSLITKIEDSIISYLSYNYDKKDILLYKQNKNNVDDILNKIKEFKIKDDSKLNEYILSQLKKHSVYSNSDIDIKIKDGKLKVVNSKVDYDKMSKSEQNYFKFLYFDILVHQKTVEGNLHIIVDDPFDSYDDVYVQDSICIIAKLIKEHINTIDTVDILSHSMYVINLYDSLKSVYSKFSIYWLDQIGITNEISIFRDEYDLLRKIEDNPSDYGIILKISNKMVDEYSLTAFSALLRNEINVERLLLKNNNNVEFDNVKNKIEDIYTTISESIDHIRKDITVNELNSIINELFFFDLVTGNQKNISMVFDEITDQYDDINIKVKTGSGAIKLVSKDDITYILIYKVLFGLKIRRLLEKKAYKIVQVQYKEVGELVEKIPDSPLYEFYDLYKYIINSFNHTSSRVVPPIFVYSFKSLKDIYQELINI